MNRDLAAAYPFARKIRLMMDNLNIHRHKSLTGCFGSRQDSYLWSRFEVHFTPKHRNWLNQAEIELNLTVAPMLTKEADCRFRLASEGDPCLEPTHQLQAVLDPMELGSQIRLNQVRPQ